jgi:hypothetical protein
MERKVVIEPFFNSIVNGIMSMFNGIIEGILSPIMSAMEAVVDIVVNFIAENVVKPIVGNIIGYPLLGLVYIFKPIFIFVGKILDFVVTIIYFVFSIFDMVLSLPMKFLQIMGIINPPKDNAALKSISQLTSVISDINNGSRESAQNVSLVINRQNFSLLAASLVFAAVLLLYYLFNDKFSFLFEK